MCPNRAVAAGVVALVSTLAVSSLPAQSPRPLSLEAFAARKQSPQDPLIGGIAFAAYSGVWGVRIGGGLHLIKAAGTAPYYSRSSCGWYGCHRDSWGGGYGDRGFSDLSVSAWTADADLIFEPFRTARVPRALLLGFSPYGFVGVGGYGDRQPGAPDSSLATMSLGAGVHHEMLGWLGVGAEARYRRPLTDDTSSLRGWRTGLEYRLALTIGFGARRHPAAIEPPGVVEPVAQPCDRGSCGSDDTPIDVPEPALASRVVDRADGYVGVPYRPGGSDPSSGFSAVGFVRYVFEREGVWLPHSVRQMARSGDEVSTRTESLRPGDLLFFANDGRHVDHVAIYAGHGRIIHATASAGDVRYDDLGEGARGEWFADHLVTARRMVPDAGRDDRWRPPAPRDDDDADRPDRAPPPDDRR